MDSSPRRFLPIASSINADHVDHIIYGMDKLVFAFNNGKNHYLPANS